MPGDTLLLPPGSVLLHIGPPKTGTTAIQDALAQARAAMAERGVVYPGEGQNHSLAARALLGGQVPKTHPPGEPGAWDQLLGQVTHAGQRRTVLSSEFFSNADERSARTVVGALGGPRVHVVITVRPLAKILPSTWQQGVRTEYLRASYEEWLGVVLGTPPYGASPPSFHSEFWEARRRHDVLVDRWAAVAGAGRVTVVVVDETERRGLMNVFERMLGLPHGLLRPVKTTNTSLDFGEVELLRHLHHAFDSRGWATAEGRTLVRTGPLRELQRADHPVRAGQRIRTPDWAAERIAQIGRETMRRISTSGVRVVGDLAALTSAPEAYGAAGPPQAVVSSETVASVLVGTILAATHERRRPSAHEGPG